jgi:hypothetical protein
MSSSLSSLGWIKFPYLTNNGGHRGLDRMEVEFTTTYVISAHHH